MVWMRLRRLWNRADRRQSDPPPKEQRDAALTCSVCGAPAETWGYRSSMQDGALVIEGTALCANHERLRTRKAAG